MIDRLSRALAATAPEDLNSGVRRVADASVVHADSLAVQFNTGAALNLQPGLAKTIPQPGGKRGESAGCAGVGKRQRPVNGSARSDMLRRRTGVAGCPGKEFDLFARPSPANHHLPGRLSVAKASHRRGGTSEAQSAGPDSAGQAGEVPPAFSDGVLIPLVASLLQQRPVELEDGEGVQLRHFSAT